MLTKCQEFFPILFVETTNFQLVFNFEQTCTVTILIWRAWYNDSYTMIAKPIRALELHHPMIQFLITGNVSRINHCDYRWQHPIPQSNNYYCHTCPGKKPVVPRVKVSKECDNDDSCTCQTFVVVSGCSSISPVQAGIISFGAISKGTETLHCTIF